MKKSYRILGLMLALILVLAPGVGQAAMWVGGQMGGNFMADVDLAERIAGVQTTFQKVKIEPSVIGGLTIGYDFVNTGFLGYDWPDWMKYFGFAVDFTYNRMDIRSQNVSLAGGGDGEVGKCEGYVAALTFLFYGHYGFFPDSVVPAGRLHPYVGVGPAVLFSGLNIGDINQSDSSADVALVVEAGLRFFALKNVSLDTAFRYRWAQPGYSYNVGGTNVGVDVNDFNSFSFLCRASYHF